MLSLQVAGKQTVVLAECLLLCNLSIACLYKQSELESAASLTQPNCRLAFFDWQREIGSYGELGQRACKCWRKIEDFLAKHKPQIAATLQ